MRRSRPRVGRPLSGRRGGERPRRSPAPRESAAASHVTRAAQPTWANPPIDVGEGTTQVMDGASAPPSETAPRQPRSRRRRRPEEGEHGVRHRQCRARARPPPRGISAARGQAPPPARLAQHPPRRRDPPPLKSSVASPTTRRRCASLSQLKPPSSGSPRSARGRLAPKPRSVEAGG